MTISAKIKLGLSAILLSSIVFVLPASAGSGCRNACKYGSRKACQEACRHEQPTKSKAEKKADKAVDHYNQTRDCVKGKSCNYIKPKY